MRSLLLAALLAAPAAAGNPADDPRWREERERRAAARASIMAEHGKLLDARYRFSGAAGPEKMSGGKLRPVGPVAISSAAYLPLPHPAQEPGHFVFPAFYGQIHNELKRVDADFDLPVQYLPDYPPPLYLTTHPEAGDVSRGMEVNPENFRDLFEGLLTPQQLEGLRLLMVPRQTLWFNKTEHRVTAQRAYGVSCLTCHVNGHTNGSFMLEPSVRPQALRARVDTPSLRGSGQARLLGSKRAIPSLSEFAAVEDYFEGETEWAGHIGALKLSREDALAMAAFLSIIDFPPAKALDGRGRLAPARASAAQRRGEALFFGKARCAECHPAPLYTDDRLHDLKASEIVGGPPEGVFKTPTLRALRDSPPYLHDGRLPTLEDAVRYFDVVLGLKLTAREREDLAAFLQAL